MSYPKDPKSGRNFDGRYDERMDCGCVSFYHGGEVYYDEHSARALPVLAWVPRPPQEPPRTAPVQGFAAGIPWDMHLKAYDAYRVSHGAQQALIEGDCRGGFHANELDLFIPGWRDELARRAAAPPPVPAERLAWITNDLVEDVIDAYLTAFQYSGERDSDFAARKITEARAVLVAAAPPAPGGDR